MCLCDKCMKELNDFLKLKSDFEKERDIKLDIGSSCLVRKILDELYDEEKEFFMRYLELSLK